MYSQRDQAGLSRRAFLGLTGGLAAAAVAGCSTAGKKSSTAQGGEVTFWKVPSQDDKAERSYFEATVKDFAAGHADSPVKYTLMPWDGALPKLTAAYSSGKGPSVAYLIIPWLNQFRGSGALAAMEDIAGDELDEYFTGTPAPAVEACKGTDGRRYGVPLLAANFFLAKNDIVWETAGRPTVPTTYEEMISYAQKTTFDTKGRALGDAGFDAKNVKHYGFNWPTEPGVQSNYFWNYLWAYGADYVNKEGTDIGFGGSEGEAALKVMKAMVDSGAITPPSLFTDPNAAGQLLLSGKAGMGWQAVTRQEEFEKFPTTKVSVIGIPNGPAGQYTAGGVGYYSVAKNVANPAATWEYIKLLLSPEKLRDYLSATLTFPGRDIGALDFYAKRTSEKVAKFAEEAAATRQYVRLTHVLPFQPEDFIIGKINDYLLGRASFDQLADQCSKQVKLLAKNAR